MPLERELLGADRQIQAMVLAMTRIGRQHPAGPPPDVPDDTMTVVTHDGGRHHQTVPDNPVTQNRIDRPQSQRSICEQFGHKPDERATPPPGMAVCRFCHDMYRE